MEAAQAIVIGGGMAGICAARVLADRYQRVTLLDRDRYPEGPAHRRGVPQSHHAHALLARGQDELERSFPGFTDALTAAGALRFDVTERFAIFRKWGWAPRASTGPATLWASRPLVEATARAHLRRVPNLEVREGTVVEDLAVTRDSRLRAAGVRVRDEDGVRSTMDADLVVDASGRGSKAPRWLETAGLARPEEDVVEAYAGYASRFYRRPPAHERPPEWWWDGLWIEGVPPDFPRGGVAFPVEGDRWLVTLVGFAKDYPPGDEAGFLAFAESLYSPVLHDAITRAAPISEVVINRSMTNRFRRYDRWRDTLDGFVAIGDSVCAYNPVYGQGMSVAAVSAAILRDTLDRLGPDARALPRAFFRAQGEFLRDVWNLAAGADFLWPTTEGKRPPGSRLVKPYFDLLVESLHCDPVATRLAVRSFHLLEPTTALFRPRLAVTALASTLRRRRQSLRAPHAERGTRPPVL